MDARSRRIAVGVMDLGSVYDDVLAADRLLGAAIVIAQMVGEDEGAALMEIVYRAKGELNGIAGRLDTMMKGGAS